MPSVLITKSNPALATLKRSWVTAEYTQMDGIGAMGSLHEAGDSLVAVTFAGDHGPTVLGSGVMVGPGLLLTATHVLDEFDATETSPLFLTFLPDAARGWLPRHSSTASGRSAFAEDRKQVSDVTLVSCTLNSEAQAHHPLALAPMQVALPLVGERLWAFGYRQGAIDAGAALVTPLVSSGLVTAVFPAGRGERMPAPCIEVEMDTIGGMSGGPVVNAAGDLIGIVTSSFDGGPSYVSLIWDALRLKVRSTLPPYDGLGAMSLFSAQMLGLVQLKGKAKRRRTGDVVINLSAAESTLFAQSLDPAMVGESKARGTPLDEDQLELFEEQWSHEMERESARAAINHLNSLGLPSARQFLALSDIPAACLDSINHAFAEDFEGVEDPDILSATRDGETISLTYAFELLAVFWTVKVASAAFHERPAEFEAHFVNIESNGDTTQLEAMQRCYFEADLQFDCLTEDFTVTAFKIAGVIDSRKHK